jgi:hypothetical protein
MSQADARNERRVQPGRRSIMAAAVSGAVAGWLFRPTAASPAVQQVQGPQSARVTNRLMPQRPPFPPFIDAYATYDGGTTCDPTDKPGPRELRDIIFDTYGDRAWSIAHPCSSSVNEHKEGRALDIAFNASVAASRQEANDLLYWLLRTDGYGNRHAFARRFGIMYIIWNRKMWRSYRPDEGWLPYNGTPNPHTDHIHFSFSWDGALRRTTWWTVMTELSEEDFVAGIPAQLVRVSGRDAVYAVTLQGAVHVKNPTHLRFLQSQGWVTTDVQSITATELAQLLERET